jgi:predicted metal-dependent hydrolase
MRFRLGFGGKKQMTQYRKFIFEKTDLSHYLVKENRKTISLRVNPKGELTIKAPLLANYKKIDAFIIKKIRWIIKSRNFFSKFNKYNFNELASGKSILYLGRQYQLIVRFGKENITFDGNKLIITAKNSDNIQKIYDKWLLYKAENIFNERLKVCIKNFSEMPLPQLSVRKLQKRWGSYSKKHKVILNPLLIQADKSAIDYVICHELCHFYYKTHCKKFYTILCSKIKNWREIKNKLELKIFAY